MRWLLCSALFVIASMAEAPVLGKIKHIVILMEENRSFDHMFGWFPGVNGLTGKEYNLWNTSDPNSKRVFVDNASPYVGPFDPDHSTPATTSKIFGRSGSKVPTMDGFIEYEAGRHEDPSSVLNMFTPDRLPIISTLAEEFTLFDHFFCSHPGPTTPNRLFQLMATSDGNTETGADDPNTILYTGETIFDKVEEAGLDWGFYYQDAPWEMTILKKLAESPLNMHKWDNFKEHARDGTLPHFSWLNPRWFVNATSGDMSNDQHPDHDVREGEKLIKEVYETLRASPAWENTLFIITYDEHGGFYDHVPPPMNIPPPDDSISSPDKGFKFDRLGVRIPMLAISPWIAKGQVIGRPTHGPQNNSEYEATSILATTKNLFNLNGFLTKRDAWAAPFDHLLLKEPRQDCPMTLPPAPAAGSAEERQMGITAEAYTPINDLQSEILESFARFRGPSELTKGENMPTLQGEGSAWIEQVVEDVLRGQHVFTKQWAEAKIA